MERHILVNLGYVEGEISLNRTKTQSSWSVKMVKIFQMGMRVGVPNKH